MAEERNDSREMTWRTLLPVDGVLSAFRGFQMRTGPQQAVPGRDRHCPDGHRLVVSGPHLRQLVLRPQPARFRARPLTSRRSSTDKPQTLTRRRPGPTYTRDRRQWNLMHKATGRGWRASRRYDTEGLVVVPKYEVEDPRHLQARLRRSPGKGEYAGAQGSARPPRTTKTLDASAKNDEYACDHRQDHRGRPPGRATK